MPLSQRVRSSDAPSSNLPIEGPSRSLALSSAAQRSKTLSDVRSSRTSGPIPLSSLPYKPGRTRGSALLRHIVAQEPDRREGRPAQANRWLRRISKSANSGEAPRLFACSYFTGSPEFHVLETMRTPFIAVAVPGRLGGHLILSGPMLDGTMRRPYCRRLRFRLPFRF